jgi:hypothetical protein
MAAAMSVSDQAALRDHDQAVQLSVNVNPYRASGAASGMYVAEPIVIPQHQPFPPVQHAAGDLETAWDAGFRAAQEQGRAKKDSSCTCCGRMGLPKGKRFFVMFLLFLVLSAAGFFLLGHFGDKKRRCRGKGKGKGGKGGNSRRGRHGGHHHGGKGDTTTTTVAPAADDDETATAAASDSVVSRMLQELTTTTTTVSPGEEDEECEEEELATTTPVPTEQENVA